MRLSCWPRRFLTLRCGDSACCAVIVAVLTLAVMLRRAVAAGSCRSAGQCAGRMTVRRVPGFNILALLMGRVAAVVARCRCEMCRMALTSICV